MVAIRIVSRHGTTSVDKFSLVEERRIEDTLLEPLSHFIAGTSQVTPS